MRKQPTRVATHCNVTCGTRFPTALTVVVGIRFRKAAKARYRCRYRCGKVWCLRLKNRLIRIRRRFGKGWYLAGSLGDIKFKN